MRDASCYSVRVKKETNEKIVEAAQKDHLSKGDVVERAMMLYPLDGKLLEGKRVVVVRHIDGTIEINPAIQA
jgi:hypothetical protein